MRIFVAAELSEEVGRKVLDVVSKLSSVHKNASWVRPENLHFTLKFLGDVPDNKVSDVEKSITKSIAGIKPFPINVNGLGYFGNRRSARVIWVGVNEGRENLVKIATELEKNLSGFRKEDKEPNPHITICRPKTGRGGGKSVETSGLVEDVESMKSMDFGSMVVKSIKLKKSTLTPKGSIYENIKEFRLAEK